MELILTIVLLLLIVITGFYFMNKIGIFLDENWNKRDESSRTRLIYIGFDMPCLCEDFLLRIDKADNMHNLVEVMIYSGTSDEVIKKLQSGELDYAVITAPTDHLNISGMESRDMMLKQKKLRTGVSNQYINMINCMYRNAAAVWIPQRISKDKDFFTDLIRQL